MKAIGVMLAFSLALPPAARATTLLNVKDLTSSLNKSAASNHQITFVTPSGVNSSSATMTVTFGTAGSFSLSGVTVNDVDLSVDTSVPINDCQGAFTQKTLASAAASGTWGVSISGQVVTFTAPTDAGAGEIAANSCVKIQIGTNATFQSVGTHQIVNPSLSANYAVSIAGTFGDTGSAGLTIVDDGTVTVSATVPPGGGPPPPPPPPPPPVISSVTATSISGTGATITWTTDITATSNVDYGTTVSYASSTSVAGYVTSHSVPITGLATSDGTLYHYRVRSAGSGTSESVSGDFTFTTLDAAAPVISNIQSSGITGTAATITWDTNENADSRVDYGLSQPYSNSASDPASVNSHSISLSGLTPNTLYRYEVTSKDAANNASTSAELTFRTLDTIPPVISNISVTNITTNAAKVNWTTDKLADSKVNYGLTVSYGSIQSDATLVANHQVALSALSPNTIYHFTVNSRDASGNSATSTDQTFQTQLNTTPPANVSNFSAAPGDRQIVLSWVNPADADFAGVRVRRSASGYPATPTSGSSAYDGGGTSFTDVGLVNGTLYYYTAFAYNTSGSFASGAIVSATPRRPTPPGPVTNLTATAGNAQIQLAWTNPSDPEFSGVVIRRSTSGFPSSPTSGTQVYTGNGQSDLDLGLTNGTTYYYSAYANDISGNFSSAAQASATPSAPPPPPGPVCGNGICEVGENSSNCPADCPPPPPPPSGPVCGNGICEVGENSGNCPADCPPPAPPPAPPVAPPPASTGTGANVSIDRTLIRLFSPNQTLILRPDARGNYHLLPRQKLTVAVSTLALKQPVKTLVLNFGNGSYLFQKIETAPGKTGWKYEGFPDELGVISETLVVPAFAAEIAQAPPIESSYVVEVTSPEDTGPVSATIIVTYQDNTTDTVSLTTVVDPLGHVFETIGGQESRVGGAAVALYQDAGGGNWQVWDASPHAQINPQITGPEGLYGFMVSPGNYYLLAKKAGYRDRQTAPFVMTSNVIDQDLELVKLPPPLTEVIIPGAPITENVFNVAKNITQQTTYVTKVFQKEVIEDPRVQTTTTNVMVPAAVAVTTVVVATAVQATSIVSYLYFIVTQPLLLIGRRKRKEYGVVYHALTKLPIDLAIVRLYRTNGRLVRTIATDKQGRYAFLVEEGEYRLEASKPNFKYPSDFLKDRKEDGRYLDIYHGEIIRVGLEGAVITANIPMDPAEAAKSNIRIIVEELLRKVQGGLAAGSIIFTLVALVLYRQLYLLIMAAVQIVLYLLFRRLARPKQPKNWGIVYDEMTKKPVPFAITRIVESQYNKVLGSSVTDSKGRYNFLVGNNKYFVSVEKAGYEPAKTQEIDLTKVKPGEGIVGLDIPIKAKTGQNEEPRPD